jgi:hypothetical protein
MINSGNQNLWNGLGTVASTASAAAVASSNDATNDQRKNNSDNTSPLSQAVPAIIQSGYAVPGEVTDPVVDPAMNSYIDTLIKKRYPNYNLA